MASIYDLPNEILVQILKLLPPDEITEFCLTCNGYLSILNDKYLLKRILSHNNILEDYKYYENQTFCQNAVRILTNNGYVMKGSEAYISYPKFLKRAVRQYKDELIPYLRNKYNITYDEILSYEYGLRGDKEKYQSYKEIFIGNHPTETLILRENDARLAIMNKDIDKFDLMGICVIEKYARLSIKYDPELVMFRHLVNRDPKISDAIAREGSVELMKKYENKIYGNNIVSAAIGKNYDMVKFLCDKNYDNIWLRSALLKAGQKSANIFKYLIERTDLDWLKCMMSHSVRDATYKLFLPECMHITLKYIPELDKNNWIKSVESLRLQHYAKWYVDTRIKEYYNFM